MPDEKPRKFVLVLLQRIEAPSIYTTPLMATFKDVEALYRKYTHHAVEFESVYLAPLLPTDDLRRQERIDWARTEQLLKTDEWWGGPRRRVFKVDQDSLLPKVRTLIKAKKDEHVVIVIGASITPPPEWSYALWAGVDDRTVAIGLSPMNPSYWGLDVDRTKRVTIVATRARAAICAVVGRQLGLDRCTNTSCFLFEPVMSVLELDSMREIGSEHGASLSLESSTDHDPAAFADDSASEAL